MSILEATTLSGAGARLSDEDLDALRRDCRGELILPEDRVYDEARSVYNAMIDKHPALIVRCFDTADIIACVGFARERNLLVSIRGGGHNGGGFGVCEGGMVIDLSRMRGTRVDPESQTAQVQAGCVWGDVDHAAHAHGLGAVSGIISTTGVAGLTLGGGHGYLTRKYGLVIDNLLSADVVLADGRSVRASERENPDLFWALRGGGGNFGVVTSFTYRLHPVNEVIGGPVFWRPEEAREVLGWYREFSVGADKDLYLFFAFLVVPPEAPFPAELHNKPMCGLVCCYTGPPEDAERAFEPIRTFRKPALYGIHSMPYPALQSAFDRFYPRGLQWYWRGDFVNEIPDAAVEQHVKFGTELPSPLSTMHLYPIDGAVHRVPEDATAFAYRNSKWSQVIVGVDPDRKNAGKITRWTKHYWEALHPHSAGGSYLNFLMDEGEERIRATYRGNYERLRQIKTRYDPQNLFRVNQNIPPA